MLEKSILTIQETVERSRQRGMPISEYTLRRALRSGAIPCRIVGRKYLIAWANVERWLMCIDNADNPATDIAFNNPIRPVSVQIER